MIQNNEMPDVCYASNMARGFSDMPVLNWDRQFNSDVEFVRKGAPSPWVDPKVQPIPEGLRGDSEIVVRHIGLIYKDRIHIAVKAVCRARILFDDGLLLGYIILPPE